MGVGGWKEGALLHQRDSQQFTAGDGEKWDSPAGERKRKEAEWREHAWNGNEGVHLVGWGAQFFFFFCEWSSSRRELTKTHFTRSGMRRQTAAVGGSRWLAAAGRCSASSGLCVSAR